MNVDASSRINIEDGDFVGVHYDSLADNGVISYEQSGLSRCCEINHDDLSHIINNNQIDKDFPVGKILNDYQSELSSKKRLPALRAFIATGETS